MRQTMLGKRINLRVRSHLPIDVPSCLRARTETMGRAKAKKMPLLMHGRSGRTWTKLGRAGYKGTA